MELTKRIHKYFSFLILNLKWNSQYGLESLSDHCAGQNDQQKSRSAHFPFQQDLTTSCTFIATLSFSPAIRFICTLFKDRATRRSILSMRSICCGDLFFPVFHASEPLMVISVWMLSLTAPCDGCKWSQHKPFISPSLIRTYLYAWQWEKKYTVHIIRRRCVMRRNEKFYEASATHYNRRTSCLPLSLYVVWVQTTSNNHRGRGIFTCNSRQRHQDISQCSQVLTCQTCTANY